jgi:hypothetical protein
MHFISVLFQMLNSVMVVEADSTSTVSSQSDGKFKNMFCLGFWQAIVIVLSSLSFEYHACINSFFYKVCYLGGDIPCMKLLQICSCHIFSIFSVLRLACNLHV